jgi:hypothetical protein
MTFEAAHERYISRKNNRQYWLCMSLYNWFMPSCHLRISAFLFDYSTANSAAHLNVKWWHPSSKRLYSILLPSLVTEREKKRLSFLLLLLLLRLSFHWHPKRI